MKITHFILTTLLFSFLTLNFNNVILATNDFSQERILIGFKDGTGWQAAQRHRSLAREFGGRVRYSYRFLPAVAANLSRVQISKLRADPRVAYIEEDGKVYALDVELDNSWGVKQIGAGNVHPYNKGAGVKIAIVDTGIDYTHPDLSANYHGGYDFVDNDNDPKDDHGHGTHCAGIVAALDNGQGVVGVAPEAYLYAVKVLDASGSGYISDIAAGIEWAIENQMQIISMSFGTNINSLTLQKACNHAYATGIILIASAGNDYRSSFRGEQDTIDYPAKYDFVIAVGATDKDNNKASWSSTGPALELVAPGVSIYSTYLNGSYATMSGSSMACPHVAGVAALILADSKGDVRAIFQSTAGDLGSAGRDQWYGFGLVNATAGMPDNLPPLVSITLPSDGDTVSGIVIIQADASDDDVVVKIDFFCGSTLIGTDDTSPYSIEWNSTVVEDGAYIIKAIATDTAYKTGSDSIHVAVDNINNPPVANAGADKTVCDSDSDGVESVILDGSASYDPDGMIVSYQWREGDVVLGTSAQTTIDFPLSELPYIVTLTVTDNDGASASDECIISVLANQPPLADAGPDRSAYAGKAITFDGSASNDPDGAIVDYDWDFGDGSIAAGVNASHVYSNIGTYMVILTVTDNGGLTATDTLTVDVSEAPQTEELIFEGAVPAKGESGHGVLIKDTAVNMYVKLTWSGINDLRLRIYNPDGDMAAEIDNSSIRYRFEETTINNPQSGNWEVVAYSNGRWKATNYTIEVVVNY